MKTQNTIRKHVSFSEIKTWAKCSWRHQLLYVKNLRVMEDTIYTDFGTIIHDANENYLRTGVMHIELAVEQFKDIWEARKYPQIPLEEQQYSTIPDHKKRTYTSWPENWPEYADPEYQYWEDNLRNILECVPAFLDTEFPGWEFVDAEAELNEVIENSDLKFRGYIDAIIRVKNKRGKWTYWILDWKTSSKRGWDRSKREDFFLTMQVVLYKHFWGTKHDMNLRDIRCGYVVMRRDVKRNRLKLIDVSAGPKTIEKARKWMRSMIKMVSEKRAIKNRLECTYCEFLDTDHCKLNL